MTEKAFDPELEKAIARQMSEPPDESTMPDVAPPRLALAAWWKAGNCPKCGAPNWCKGDEIDEGKPPRHYYTCPCAALASEEARSLREKRARENELRNGKPGPRLG